MREPQEPLFLARETYRRRRVMDAARLLPIAGGVAFAVPLLWSQTTSPAVALVYVFCSWLVLILAAGLLGRRLSLPPEKAEKKRGG